MWRRLLVYRRFQTEENVRPGIFRSQPRAELSVSLGKLTTVFPARVYSIDVYERLMETQQLPIVKRHKTLESCHCDSRTVWNCTRILPVWVPGHISQKQNGQADGQQGKGRKSHSLDQNRISVKNNNNLGRRKRFQYFQSLLGLRYLKAFMLRFLRTPITIDLLELSRHLKDLI